MVVKAKGDARTTSSPAPCFPTDERFAMGEALGGHDPAGAPEPSHCARFCVLGGASCSG